MQSLALRASPYDYQIIILDFFSEILDFPFLRWIPISSTTAHLHSVISRMLPKSARKNRGRRNTPFLRVHYFIPPAFVPLVSPGGRAEIWMHYSFSLLFSSTTRMRSRLGRTYGRRHQCFHAGHATQPRDFV